MATINQAFFFVSVDRRVFIMAIDEPRDTVLVPHLVGGVTPPRWVETQYRRERLEALGDPRWNRMYFYRDQDLDLRGALAALLDPDAHKSVEGSEP